MISTCRGCNPTSSVNSRYIACSGLSPGLMPPCGNCHESCLMRFPQKTSFFEFSRIIPTFERYPLRSIIQFTRLIHHKRTDFFIFYPRLKAVTRLINSTSAHHSFSVLWSRVQSSHHRVPHTV